MSSSNVERNNTNQMPENRGNYQNTQQSMRMYIDQHDRTIKHKGYIDTIKAPFNTRILSINTCGFAPSNDDKVEMMIEKCKELRIDVLLLNETNTKWSHRNQDKIKRRLKELGREINIKTADSGRWELTKKEWLPGGVMSVVRGSVASLVQDEEVYKGKYGNWIAMKIVGKEKTVVFINFYRIPVTSNKDATCSSLIQYNLIDGKAKTAAQYRSEIFEEIEKYIKDNEDITDVLIAGDMNQSIGSIEVQKFFERIGVVDVHQLHNNIELKQLDHTESRGSKPIDTIAISRGLKEFVEGCMLQECNDIILTDHRSYIIDLNLEAYFDQHLSEWDQINHSILNPSRRSHREKFYMSLHTQLSFIDIEEKILEIYDHPSNEQIEVIDEMITDVLQNAVRSIQGINRNIPFSQQKVTVRAKKMF